MFFSLNAAAALILKYSIEITRQNLKGKKALFACLRPTEISC